MHALSNEDLLDSIVDRINEQTERVADYYLYNTDNSYADYVTWGWKEGAIDEVYKRLLSALEDNLDEDGYARAVASLQAKGNKQAQIEAAVYHSAPERLGIERNDLDLFSLQMSEIEEELDEETAAQLSDLTAEELDYVQRNAEGYVKGSYVYVNVDYNRWALVLNIDALIEELLGE